MQALWAVLILCVVCSSEAKEVALTIDDAPMPGGRLFTAVQRTDRLIEVLKKEKVDTVFFCNSARLNQDHGGERLLKYAAAGFGIANHTRTHADAERTPLPQFLKEIDDADRTLSVFPTFRKWFRFPYLKEGGDKGSRDRIRSHLQSRGYRNGYVTVDSFDYAVEDFLRKSRRPLETAILGKACKVLGDIVVEGLDTQDRLARRHLGQSVRQVLLMHENDLNAYCLNETIRRLRASGWDLISPSAAYEDPLLAPEPATLWTTQGRVAAAVAAKDGFRFASPWDRPGTLERELKKRLGSPSSLF